MDPKPNPMHIIYFCYDRTSRMPKGANSIENWLRAFNFLIKSQKEVPCFRTEEFNRHKKALVKFHSQPRTQKLPFKLIWLVQWARAIGVTPTTWFSCDYNALMKVLIVLITFFTISRLGEIYFTDKTENKEWDIITTGIKFGDVSFGNKHYCNDVMSIEVNWYKNQQHYNVPKRIHIEEPICSNYSCKCQFLNFHRMYKIALSRRRAMHRKLSSEVELGARLSAKFRKKLDNLAIAPDKYVFVNTDGSIWRETKMRETFCQIRNIIQMRKPECYPPYSAKVGAMSLVNQQEIQLLKVIKYVAWSIATLPHMSQTYISISEAEMATIPYEMIHGKIQYGDRTRCVDLSGTKLIPFDLRDAPEQARMWK